MLALVCVFAGCGGGTADAGHDQTEPSEVDIEETGDDGSLAEDTGDTDSSLVADSDTSQVPDSDAASEADGLETDTSEGEVDQDEVADETTVPPLDADQDGVPDTDDQCPEGRRNWTSTPPTDHDGDGCRDEDEDNDDDNDGVLDEDDACPTGALGWTSNPETDHDGDGCRDEDEDDDGDNDSIPDDLDECPRGANDWMSGAETDADRDGCRDADEDFDLDGDGVADDVDTCPGFFDPEQIDASAPFGPGHGDLCAEPCREVIRHPLIELSNPDPNGDLFLVGPQFSGPVRELIRYRDWPSRFRVASSAVPVLPSPFSYLRITKADRSAENTYVCHLQPIEVTSISSILPLRLEVSVSGTLFSDFRGISDLGLLMFPTLSPTEDRDGDGLLEPWSRQNYLYMQPNTSPNPFYQFALVFANSVGQMSGLFLRAGGPDHATFTAVYNGATGVHIYLTRFETEPRSIRVRIFLDEELVEDLELPSIDRNQAIYVGEYFNEPRYFVKRKRCAVNNTLCANDIDCPGGPCVFRVVPRDFYPSN